MLGKSCRSGVGECGQAVESKPPLMLGKSLRSGVRELGHIELELTLIFS